MAAYEIRHTNGGNGREYFSIWQVKPFFICLVSFPTLAEATKKLEELKQ